MTDLIGPKLQELQSVMNVGPLLFHDTLHFGFFLGEMALFVIQDTVPVWPQMKYMCEEPVKVKKALHIM